ncbi:MAG: metal ABC transporter permease [Bdellovibrionota bacterium]
MAEFNLESYLIFWPGVVALISLSAASALLGIFLSLRKMSLAGDAISHSLLPGIAIAYAFKGLETGWLSVGAFISGSLAITILVFLNRGRKHASDAHMALLYLTFLSTGILILTAHPSRVDILDLLFGNLLALDSHSLLWILPFCALLILATIIKSRSLWLTATDPEWAQYLRKSLTKNEFWFLFSLNLCLVLAFQVAGTLLSLGLLLFPVMTIRQWSSHLSTLFIGSVLFGIANSIIGLFLCFYLNTPAGPSVVLASAIMYFMNLQISRRFAK